MSPFVSKEPEDQETRRHVRDLTAWIADMLFIIMELINCLDSTICSWENFRRRDIQYFCHHCEPPPGSICLDSLCDEIDRIFDELRGFQTELGKVQKELSGNFSNAVSAPPPPAIIILALIISRGRLI